MDLQVLTQAVNIANDDGDDMVSVCLRWKLCKTVLLGGEGPTFPLGKYLSLVKKVTATLINGKCKMIVFEMKCITSMPF